MFLAQVPNEFLCALCQEVLCNPVSCQLGHAFCMSCLSSFSMKSSPNCPTCLVQLPGVKPKAQLVAKMVGTLGVRCVHASSGTAAATGSLRKRSFGGAQEPCTWTGKLADLDAHLKECPCVQIPCPNGHCKEVILRRQIEAHKAECDKRKIPCGLCQQPVPASEKAAHDRSQCPKRRISCPSGCGRQLERQAVAHHLANECQKLPANCPFHALGCPARFERSRMAVHIKEAVGEHLQLSLARSEALAKDLEETKSSANATAANVDALKQSNESLQAELAKLSDAHEVLESRCSAAEEQLNAQATSIAEAIAELKANGKMKS